MCVRGLPLAVAVMVLALPGNRGRCEETPVGKSNPRALTEGLRAVSKTYGNDAVTLQILLFTHALKAGPALAVETGIDGVSVFDGHTYLGFHVDTGMIFNSLTHNRRARLQALWSGIVAPSLRKLKRLELSADGVKIDLRYSHRRFTGESQLRDAIEDTGTAEHAVVYFMTDEVLSLVSGELTEQSLLDRGTLTVNDVAYHLVLNEASPTSY